MRLFSFLVLILMNPVWLSADENILPWQEILRQNYQPVEMGLPWLRGSHNPPPFAPHSLPWPVSFQDERHTMGNNMAQYQFYGDVAYFHGGCELRTQSGEWEVE